MEITPLASLPHGPEFRFIDRVLTLTPGIAAVAEYRVRGTESFLAGHFPGDPIFPGVLLVEAGAQLAGMVIQSIPRADQNAPLRLTALRAVKILGTARPGQTMRIEATLIQQLGPLVQACTRVSVDGNVIMEGELTLSGVAPAPEQV